MGTVTRKEQCPSCAKQGRDRSGNNLAVYDDGSTYCFSCGYSDRNQRQGAKVVSDVDIGKYASYPVRPLTHKPISEEIVKRYGVRCVSNVETGKIDSVLYPYYEGKVLKGYKSRKLPKDFTFKGSMENTGLFGQQLYPAGGKVLIIVEGEDDALAFAEMLKDVGKEYPVVSIPTGADQNGKLDKRILEQYEYMSSFGKVLIALDNDGPGIATAESLAELLSARSDVSLFQMPEDCKDASDILIKGLGGNIMAYMRDSVSFSPRGVEDGGSVSLKDLMKKPPRGYLTPYKDLDDKLKGLRKGELTLFTAGSGIGKSTIAREIAYHFVKEHGLSVANIMLEEPVEKSKLGYIALDNDIPLSSLYMSPEKYESMATQLQASYDKLLNNGRNFFLSHFGSLGNEELLTKMRYFAMAKQADFIILDHISMVISGQDNTNERKTIDLLMTDLAAFCNETGVGVLAVVHLKRKNTSGGKDKSLNEGGQVSLTDLRGSGGLEQMAWNVVALERNQQDTEEANFSKVRVLKNRMFGFTGEAGKLYFNPETGRLLPAPNVEEYYE